MSSALKIAEQSPNPQTAPGAVFETASKVFASAVLVIYACGFLITSIHDFQYGFSEMNPFRPRILTAGAWFFLFLAVPFALVRQLTKTEAYKQSDVKGIARLANLSWAYIISCNFIAITSRPIFHFDSDVVSPAASLGPWKTGLLVAGTITLLVVFVKYAKTWPKWVGTAFTAGLVLDIAWNGFNDFYRLGRFHSSAAILWLLVVGAVFAFELTMRSWKLTLGNWTQTLIALLVFVFVFATRYYPHILASWGGGVPIPITITYTKDAAKNPSQDLVYLLIDETDAGFYVVGGEEKGATFIPRGSVGLIRFSAHSESANR